MAWSFLKSFKIAPHVALSVSADGIGMTLGRERVRLLVGASERSDGARRRHKPRKSSTRHKSIRIAPGVKIHVSDSLPGVSKKHNPVRVGVDALRHIQLTSSPRPRGKTKASSRRTQTTPGLRVERCPDGLSIDVGSRRFRVRIGMASVTTRRSGRGQRSTEATRSSPGKSVRIAPGVRMNLFESGLGVSLGTSYTRVRFGVSSSGSVFASGNVPRTVPPKPTWRGLAGRAARARARIDLKVTKFCALAIVLFSLGVGLAVALTPFAIKYSLIVLGIGSLPSLIVLRRASLRERQVSGMGGLPGTHEGHSRRTAELPAPRGENSGVTLRLAAAQAHLDAGSPRRAAKILAQILEESYDDDVAMLLATAHYRAGQFDQAIRVAQGIEQDSRWWPTAVTLLGAALAKGGRPELAIRTLESIPRRTQLLDGDLKELHYQLAESYRAKGDEQKAMVHYRRAESCEGSPPEVEVEVHDEPDTLAETSDETPR